MIFYKTTLCLGCLQIVGGNCILRHETVQETTIYINGLQGGKATKVIIKSTDPTIGIKK